ncbi:MAG: helix-turn-helix domain-containing protein [Acidovorax sp.]|nr:helix-turn-helix domain-containing protein [Acidovorax sp.]
MTAPQPLPSTLFTTDQQAGEARFEAWRSSISVVFDVAPLAPAGIASFQATVQATHLGNLLVGDLHFAGQQFLRAQPRVVRDGLDHYLVQWYRTGGFVGQRDGGTDIEVRPGDIAILDLGRTLRTFARPSHVMTLIVPRDLLHQAMGVRDSDLHGTVLRGGSALGGLLSDHLLSLQRRLPGIALDDAAAVARASVQMLAACVRPGARTLHGARGAIEGVTLQRIQQHIQRHLGTDLSADALCRTFGISRSALYRLFEPLGGVAHHVQQRRLLQAYHALANPANRRLRVAEVATRAGFASNAHFSRAFRATFDMAPSEVRAPTGAGAAGHPPAAQGSSAEYAAWVRGLHGTADAC